MFFFHLVTPVHWLSFFAQLVAMVGLQWLLHLPDRLTHDALTSRLSKRRHLSVLFWRAAVPRLSVWLWLCGLYTACTWQLAPGLVDTHRVALQGWQTRFVAIVTLLCGLSLAGRMLYLVNRKLRVYAATDATHWERALAVLGGESLQIGLPLGAAYVILPLLGLEAGTKQGVGRLLSMVLIGAVGYVLVRLVNLAAEKVRIGHEKLDFATSMRARALYTQVAVLRRMTLVLIVFLTVASILMLFHSARHLGASLLASAGLVGIIAGVASQRSLANLVAGFQIAVTQRILLEDVVTVEGEYGQIEEITLTYVVVRLGDLRRLVLPISYFLEKPVLNWTRTSAETIGTVFLYVDPLASLDAIEAEFERVLTAHPLWNGHTKKFVLFEAHEHSLQLRLSMSADNPDRLSDLRSAVLRALVDFLRREHPDSLPRIRTRFERGSLPSPPLEGCEYRPQVR